MALTISVVERTVFGNKRIVIADVDFDSSYPTGGESLQASDVGLKAIDFLQATPKSGYIFEYDYTNEKLKALYPTKSQESNLALADHTVTEDLVIDAGSTTVTSTAANGDIISGTISVSSHSFTGTKGTVDAGPAEEVANGTDLSSLTDVRVMIIGS